MRHIILYADDFNCDVWTEYCEICGEDADACSLTISFDEINGVRAEYENDEREDLIMNNERLMVLLYNAIVCLEDFECDREYLETEIGITEEEYVEVMGE